MTYKEVIAKAEELGAEYPYNLGSNWVWASNFPSKEAGEKFVAYLDSIGWEHRGVYFDSQKGKSSVRYRYGVNWGGDTYAPKVGRIKDSLG